jgi:hypothetical protein
VASLSLSVFCLVSAALLVSVGVVLSLLPLWVGVVYSLVLVWSLALVVLG